MNNNQNYNQNYNTNGNGQGWQDTLSRLLNTPDHTADYDKNDISSNKIFACLAEIPVLFWLPLCACPGSRFARFHANNGLIMLIASVVSGVLSFVPVIGGLLTWVASTLLFIIWLLATVSAVTGTAKELVLLGKLNFKFFS